MRTLIVTLHLITLAIGLSSMAAVSAEYQASRLVRGRQRPVHVRGEAWGRSAGIQEAARPSPAADDPDRLYRQREDLASARRAADLWAVNAAGDFEASWKLARACYWLGTHGDQQDRRRALERGIKAGESAARLMPDRPEGHFWFAANMGALAESYGLGQGLKYRGKIKEELERVLAIDPSWQDGSADAALGQWYFKVPRLLGGSRFKAEEHLRRALAYNPDSRLALSELADVVAASGRREDAIALLKRLIAAPGDPGWIPEDNDLIRKAEERLKTLRR